MSQVGIGVNLHYLGGGSKHSASEYVGRKITAAEIKDEHLLISFDDGVTIDIFDNGQSCCESRYMMTDDDVSSLVGHKLMRIEDKAGPNEESEEEHETCFIEVGTDAGFITLVNHVEHNGYYGGFGLTIVEKKGKVND